MINKEILDKLSSDELKELKNWILTSSIDTIESDLFLAQRRKEYKRKRSSLNKKFDLTCMFEWGIFTIAEIEVLYMNKINNLDDLIKCDLDSLVGITPSMKLKFKSRRKFYDLSNYWDCIQHDNAVVKSKK